MQKLKFVEEPCDCGRVAPQADLRESPQETFVNYFFALHSG